MKEKWYLLISFFKSNRLLTTVAFICGFIYNIFTLLIPISIGRFYEFNFGFSSHRLKLIESFPFLNTDSFIRFLFFFIALVIIRFVFEYINKYLISIAGERFVKNLREQLFEHQLQINTTIYDQKGIGKYLLRYSGDMKSIQDYITKGMFQFSQDMLLIIFLIAAIALIDLNSGLVVAASIAFTIVALFFINKALNTISVNRRNQRSGLLSFVNTRLRAISSIKVLNKYSIEQKRYVDRSEKLYQTGKKYQVVANLIYSFIPAITYLMIALVMWYVYYLKTNSGDTFNQPSFLILILLIISFMPILRRTFRVSIIWKLGNISFAKLLAIFTLDAENRLPLQRINFSGQSIKLNDVSFKYSTSDNLIFNKANILFSPKNLTLVFGDSGSGKNTLINLLLKIHKPTTGNITYGENDQKALSEKTIRRNISIVSDDFPLYGKTVYEAIVYSRNKEVELKAGILLNELQQFEDDRNRLKLHDLIGDLGKSLTSGQKRILMYCRAFLSNKPWLILDTPFKDQNPDTVKHLANLLNSLSGKKGIIVFDSKIPEALAANRIYAIKNNALVEVKSSV